TSGWTEEHLLREEIDYCIRKEMVTGLSDFFIRRTGLLYFDPARMIQLMPLVKNIFREIS
ncbi:MAG: glycerol-3-phosphate dehydrogenase C-terminal domain-containing protein, partial [Candidatus Nitrosotenuis sp.]